MKFSANWLKELTGLSWPADVWAERLAELGFPVAGMEMTGVAIQKVVSAKILSVEKHPNADKLSVTQIDDGSGQRTVVCGANNIAAGQIVPLALPGAKFPNGLTIAVAKLRGVESQGMLCSERELGLSSEHGGILQLPLDTKLGVEVSQLFESDILLDLEIPPNRPDVLSHMGLARELAAHSGKKLKTPVLNWRAPTKGDPFKIENRESRLCPRYLGKLIHGAKIAPSPSWMAKRLSACGIRPINNIVDITNYVLLEWGHPLHAFDLSKLQGSQILVRRAKQAEKIEALDGKVYELTNDDLVIADHENPVAIAGLMGGQHSGVTDSTVDILLESAVFNPSLIRATSRRLGLKSESSLRFEKGTSPDTAQMASLRAALLILELAGGRPGLAQDSYPKKTNSVKIDVQLPRMMKLIGTDIKESIIERILTNLGYGLTKEKKRWKLTKPSHRQDVTEEADVVEDVLRFYGYNKIPSRLDSFRPGKIDGISSRQVEMELSDWLKGCGFNETLTSSMSSVTSCDGFETESDRLVYLANPLSQEETILRPLLLPNLLNAVAKNIHYQRESVFLFENGVRHSLAKPDKIPSEERALALVAYGEVSPRRWNSDQRDVDFFFLKGAIESLNKNLKLNWQFKFEGNRPFLHPHQSFSIHVNGGSIGWGGILHPELAKKYDMKRPCVVCEIKLDSSPRSIPQFKEFSKVPFVERDIAILVDKSLPWAKLEEVIWQAGAGLLQDVVPFDIFTGDTLDAAKKSVAFRCRLQTHEKTLLESDINAAMDRIKSALTTRCGAQLR